MFTTLRTTRGAPQATHAWPLLFCCLVAIPAYAQAPPPPELPAQPSAQSPAGPAPANLTFVDGAVDVIHDGVTERAEASFMLLEGDIVRTANGRAEIVFGDGTLLHVDHDTEFEVLSPTRLRLINGRLVVRVSASAPDGYAIDTQAASVRLDPRGEYGLTADAQYERLEVRVARGVAELDDNGERVVVRGGEMAKILGAGSRPLLQSYNAARWDTFERWAAGRTNGLSNAASSRYVPSELRPYGPVFDTYGRWDHVAPYGNVWFPAVASSWRPYYSGSWNQTRYGLTWIGHDPWAWPTHHYGRWGFNGAAWYWIPANVWAPAWVSWGYAPGFVSWCPLGWNGQPVLGFWNRPGRPYYDPWKAWTIMPRDKFGFGDGGGRGRRFVRVNAVDPATLPDRTKRAMVVQNVPPAGATASHAVPRGATYSLPPATRGVGRTGDAGKRDAIETPRAGGVRRAEPMPRTDTAPATETTPAFRNPGTVEAPKIGTRDRRYPAASDPQRVEPSEPQSAPVIRQAPTYDAPASSSYPVERRTAPERTIRDKEVPRYSPPPDQSRTQREATPPASRGREGGVSASPRQGSSSPPPASAPKTQGKTSSGGESSGGGGGKRKPGE